MKHNIFNLVGIATVATLVYGATPFSGFCAENARSALAGRAATARTGTPSTTGRVVSRNVGSRPETAEQTVGNQNRSATISRSAQPNGTANVARSARSAVAPNTSAARSATKQPVARSATNQARATAVFTDVTKIGSGYAKCRDAYATCMDQFCANANEKYRRCFCSSRFTEFRDAENALDQAKNLLIQFEDNNLNAVDKTAAEVNAMYSATAGEMAIKKDTSAASKMLDQISDLLSGKKTFSSSNNSSTSLGILSLDITSDVGDIWNGDTFGSNSGSIFSTGGTNMAELEGTSLYNESNKQCTAMMEGVCESDSILKMVRSSYSILISQDCNTYSKSVDAKRETVKQTVRTAEKYLREARLEEYRSHNSADVNECIDKVRTALSADTACGANYKRCLDYTGVYINQTTGDPIYSQRLFELTDVITLGGVNDNRDILDQNTQFNKFLDSKRIYATTALDSCRDIANTVWSEFKRTALIEIAQAQDEKIEEVKMSCVSTMADCYDTQTSALKDFDNTTAVAAGAMSAYAARQMCAEKVNACASLYGDTDGCTFDGNGKLQNGTKRCGLTALLNFVDAVDTTRIAEGCEVAMRNFATDLCTPSTGSMGYPWNCRTLSQDELNKRLSDARATYCNIDTDDRDVLQNRSGNILADLQEEIHQEIVQMMYNQCVKVNGIWVSPDIANKETGDEKTAREYSTMFYGTLYGSTRPTDDLARSYGYCAENTVRSACEAQDVATGSYGYAQYVDSNGRGRCVLSSEWYQDRCENILNGVWKNGSCEFKESGIEYSKSSGATATSQNKTETTTKASNTGKTLSSGTTSGDEYSDTDTPQYSCTLTLPGNDTLYICDKNVYKNSDCTVLVSSLNVGKYEYWELKNTGIQCTRNGGQLIDYVNAQGCYDCEGAEIKWTLQ